MEGNGHRRKQLHDRMKDTAALQGEERNNGSKGIAGAPGGMWHCAALMAEGPLLRGHQQVL